MIACDVDSILCKIPTYVAGSSTYWSPRVDHDDNQVEFLFCFMSEIHSL